MVNFPLKEQPCFSFHDSRHYFVTFQLLAALDSLKMAVDTAQMNVTDMASMVPMVKEQFRKNQEQLAITKQNAMDANNQSQIASRVCNCIDFFLKTLPLPSAYQVPHSRAELGNYPRFLRILYSVRAVFILVSKSNWFCVYYATRLV